MPIKPLVNRYTVPDWHYSRALILFFALYCTPRLLPASPGLRREQAGAKGVREGGAGMSEA